VDLKLNKRFEGMCNVEELGVLKAIFNIRGELWFSYLIRKVETSGLKISKAKKI
jgi:hypothetical protein